MLNVSTLSAAKLQQEKQYIVKENNKRLNQEEKLLGLIVLQIYSEGIPTKNFRKLHIIPETT